jgi:hypothetical protein
MTDGHPNLFIDSGVRQHVPLYVQLNPADLKKAMDEKSIDRQEVSGQESVRSFETNPELLLLT